jgi:transposase InsO family protein
LSTQEQRYRAVLAVEAGGRVGEVAFQFGVSRQSLHAWLVRYRADGLDGLADRSHRPASCAHQAPPEVEAAVCEMRRDHPRWGPTRIAFELGRDGCPGRVPSRATVYRILLRFGLVAGKKRRRGRDDYRRWQRDKPMELWQMDIVGGILLADGSEAKVVTGVDDHSRFCVIAKVVPRQTGRAVCAAFVEGLLRHGLPEEVLTDNGKQFTDRFGKGGEVLFDRICRTNGIIHRLTQPASPTTTGKVERFHQSLERELIDHSGVFADVAAAQTAIDAWVAEYNTRRPHQSLDMATPASKFGTPEQIAARRGDEALLPLRIPGVLTDTVSSPTTAVAQTTPTTVVPAPRAPVDVAPIQTPQQADPVDVAGWTPESIQSALRQVNTGPAVYSHGPVEFEKVVPPSGNLGVMGKQFWLGPARSGQVLTFWADTQVIHISIGGGRVKSVRSHLTINDLAALSRLGARPAGPSPLPVKTDVTVGAIELDRAVGTAGWVSVGNHIIKVNELRGGTRVGIRLDGPTLAIFDLDTRELIRTGANPFTPAEMLRIRQARPAGPPPHPRTDPIRIQRRASNSGGISVCRQKIALGRIHAYKTVTVHVSADTLSIECDDGVRTVRRTTDDPVFQVKAQRPRKVNKI